MKTQKNSKVEISYQAILFDQPPKLKTQPSEKISYEFKTMRASKIQSRTIHTTSGSNFRFGTSLKSTFNLRDITTPWIEAPPPSPPKVDQKARRKRLLRKLVTFSSLSQKGFNFLKPGQDNPMNHNNQHFNGTRKQNHRRQAVLESEDLDYFICAVVNQEPQKTVKLHKIAPRLTSKITKYPQAYQHRLDQFQNVRYQTFLNEIEQPKLPKPQLIRIKHNSVPAIMPQSPVSKLLYSIVTPMKLQTAIPTQPQSMVIPKSPDFQYEQQLSPGQKIQRLNRQLYGFKAVRTLLQNRSKQTLSFKEKQDRMKLVRMSLLSTLNQLKKLKITPKELMEHKIFPAKPLEHHRAKEFLTACKANQLELVSTIIIEHRYIVYEFDTLMMTGLHWAAKRGLIDVAAKLLARGADPDAQDIVARTPLYLAIDNGHNEIVKLLLFHQASPWNLENCKYEELYTHNPEAKHILSNARKVHILLRITPAAQRNAIWMREQLAFFVDPNME